MTDVQTFKFNKAAKARQTRIYSDPRSYSAFPHVVQMEGDELLLAFRQAPRHPAGVRHTDPRSLITVIRSPDAGQTWNVDDAAQLAAGVTPPQLDDRVTISLQARYLSASYTDTFLELTDFGSVKLDDNGHPIYVQRKVDVGGLRFGIGVHVNFGRWIGSLADR